jgi:hypothetical protein
MTLITLSCSCGNELEVDSTEAHEYQPFICWKCALDDAEIRPNVYDDYENSMHTQSDNISSFEGK